MRLWEFWAVAFLASIGLASSPGCVPYTVPSGVAAYCPESQAVLNARNAPSGMGPWPDLSFVKLGTPPGSVKAGQSSSARPCANERSPSDCMAALGKRRQQLVLSGEPAVELFEGVVYRAIFPSGHGYPTQIVRVNHHRGKTLLTVRVVSTGVLYPDGSYWTWTRFRELSAPEWDDLQGRVERANLWSLPWRVPDERLAFGGMISLEAYDGVRHHLVARRSDQTPAFHEVVDWMRSYARCPVD